MKAVIQAGGKGTRLRPYTMVLPKPLMPVGSMPVIEMLLKWLRRDGFSEVYITIGYLGHLIRSLCGDGSQWGLNIVYSQEPEPLGTIGPLSLIREHLDESFLVLNGDLITDLDLRAFVQYHRDHQGTMTVGVTEKKVKLDLGILESKDNRIIEFQEKPTKRFQVSMGIYCMEPKILDLIPPNVPFGFDDLMHIMLEDNYSVYTYKHDGLWMDIGREEDFKEAQHEFYQNSSNISHFD